ncbi:MAG: hypothetical protein KF862_07440 [Chitinophagaceae bacterium]|nr:hypothetical protein [Chitinophagaceae bacterium]
MRKYSVKKISPVPQHLGHRRRFYIGIDCGVNTGIAKWDKEMKRLTLVKSTTILQAIAEVKDAWEHDRGTVFVRVEDARLRKWIPRQKTESSERGRREGAGSVKRDAIIWEEFLTSENIPHEFVAPKNNKTKMTAEYFKKISGWMGSTNSHARDAAALVIGL